MLKVVSVSQMFAYLGNADVIYNKYQGKPTFHVSARRLLKLTPPARTRS